MKINIETKLGQKMVKSALNALIEAETEVKRNNKCLKCHSQAD